MQDLTSRRLILTSATPPLLTPQLKDLLMAAYFAADHVVWAYQVRWQARFRSNRVQLPCQHAAGQRSSRLQLRLFLHTVLCPLLCTRRSASTKTKHPKQGQTLSTRTRQTQACI